MRQAVRSCLAYSVLRGNNRPWTEVNQHEFLVGVLDLADNRPAQADTALRAKNPVCSRHEPTWHQPRRHTAKPASARQPAAAVDQPPGHRTAAESPAAALGRHHL